MARKAAHDIIDLTGDDTVAAKLPGGRIAYALHLARPTPGGAAPSHSAFQLAQPHIFPHPSTASPSINRPLQDGDDHLRPVKRPRTEEPIREPSVSGKSREDVTVILGRCLEEQVFPHIERATAKLSSDIYDLDKLGAKVIRTIVDKKFQESFNKGEGRLSSSVELTIAAGVHRLVTELSSNQDYRRNSRNSTPTSPPTTATTTATAGIISTVTVPTVLPSIERDADSDSDEEEDESSGGDGNGGDDEDEDEDEEDDEEDDEDEDADSSEEEEGEGEGEGGANEDEIEDDDDGDPDPEPAIPPVPQSHIRTPPHHPPHHRPPKKERPPISPQQLRTRAKASQWQSGKSYHSVSKTNKQLHSFGIPLHPYASALMRQQIASGVAKASVPLKSQNSSPSQVFHVDFNDAEIHYLRYVARHLYGRPVVDGQRSILRDLRNVLKKVPNIRASLADIHAKGYVGYDSPPFSLTKRSSGDVTNFLNDLYSKKVNTISRSLFLERSNSLSQSETSRANKLPALLLLREIIGNRLGASRTYQNFITTAKSNREDYLEPQVEWTNCAGDIMTISWLSNTDFVCGTTTHSDSHNQQYNKPGNLLLGSAVTTTLRAYPDHRIIRPVVPSGDNALDSMVASQDPWLFTSVVSSDYDPSLDLAFTSSFDKTVKVWKLKDRSLTSLGTWQHGGHVNFVVTSKNSTGTVATAADVPTEAVRVYHLDWSNISGSRYDSYSCTRVHDEDYVPSEKWAYYPAAIRWGLAPNVNHLLLIGYSPRSPKGEDHEIPEDKRNTGELCLWNTVTKTQVKVNSAKTQNVFEVVWHPSRDSFAAATSASQVLERTDQSPRTQVRIFEPNQETGQYGAIKSLDCAAIDINELSIMPNSLLYSYVAASCTNGKVYVWDTAGADLPICVLEHGDPVEELLGDREQEDVGVKFMAWATTADRLYTGSSDGVVKVWNIRHDGVLVKDLIEAAAPITFGAFSPDFTRLVIGDGSGRVYLLELEDPEDEDLPNPAHDSAEFSKVQTTGGSHRAIRKPRPFLPHPELPPPVLFTDTGPGQKSAKEYLNTAQLMMHPNPTIGAIQGVNYAGTGLFRSDAHVNEDPHEPLLPTFQSRQQSSQELNRQRGVYRTWLPRQPSQKDNDLVYTNGQHEDWYTYQPKEQSDDDGDSDQSSDYQDAFDFATWVELKKEKAELDDSLIELDYETSILDSDDEKDQDVSMSDK
ncbi:WD40 repeat-like protein [Hypoxylon argillaceum]|nr:WD40 repeat-like protein [Hypoxylon argillaceum]